MKLAIAILNWNGLELLKEYMPHVVSFSKESDIYIIDNNSTDHSLDFITKEYPQIKCIKLDKNYGYAGGYNKGLQKIDADIYCLLNSDIRVTKDWTIPVLKCFKNNPNIAAIQPHILDDKKNDYFEYAGAAGGFMDSYGYSFCRGRIFNVIEKDNGQYNKAQDIFWASGACLFIRKSVFDELNGFDSNFFAHQEEIDLCWRIHNKGYKILAIPETKVFHKGAGTLSISYKKMFLNFRNSLFLMLKNLPKSKLFQILLIRLCLDGVAAFSFISKGQLSFAWAVLMAHLAFYKKFIYYYKKRGNTFHTEKYYYVKNINIDYRIKRQRLYSDLKKE